MEPLFLLLQWLMGGLWQTQLYVEKQVFPYLWVGLWPCDLETRHPVAAPSLPFLWLLMVLQAPNSLY